MAPRTHGSAIPAAIALTLGLLLLPAPASASQCREVPLARLIDEADVVFVGRALTWDAELATTFAVERVYKGTVPAQVIVESGAVKYAALAPPDRYLVLAVRDEPGTRPGNLYVHTCGGSQRLLTPTDIPASLGEGTTPAPAPTPTPEPAADPLPRRVRPVDPPGLSDDSDDLRVAPGILAFDLADPDFRWYSWGVAGGRLFTGARHFNRRLLPGAEPMVKYSYPVEYAFCRARIFIGARF